MLWERELAWLRNRHVNADLLGPSSVVCDGVAIVLLYSYRWRAEVLEIVLYRSRYI